MQDGGTGQGALRGGPQMFVTYTVKWGTESDSVTLPEGTDPAKIMEALSKLTAGRVWGCLAGKPAVIPQDFATYVKW